MTTWTDVELKKLQNYYNLEMKEAAEALEASSYPADEQLKIDKAQAIIWLLKDMMNERSWVYKIGNHSTDYKIKVVSWENDGDDYETNEISVASKEEAKAYYDMMQLCESENNQPKGVIKLGNACDYSNEQIEVIVNFLKANPILLKEENKDATDEELVDLFSNLSSKLLGSSDWYVCRVMESCVVYFNKEKINF